MITVGASEFKAKCLGLISDVETKRETVIVTKHGRQVAKLVPMELAEDDDPLDAFRFPGKIEILGDIVSPCYSDEELEQFERRLTESLD
jgi:prevent-host-death family protein